MEGSIQKKEKSSVGPGLTPMVSGPPAAHTSIAVPTLPVLGSAESDPSARKELNIILLSIAGIIRKRVLDGGVVGPDANGSKYAGGTYGKLR